MLTVVLQWRNFVIAAQGFRPLTYPTFSKDSIAPTRHVLDVEENEIRLPLPNCSDCGFPIAAFANHIHAVMLAQEAPYGAARQRFIINHQRRQP
jgi:hypothetical protein